jgi:Dehydrogenases with different specificities (related to short-chain alcohol dehydrogenases)
MRFQHKTVFITGGGGYIGGETAKLFALEGATVAVCDINQEALEKTVLDIKNSGGTALGFVADVTDSKSVNNAIAAAVKAFDSLDILVHVAGGSARKLNRRLVDQTDDVIDFVLKMNLYGALYASRAAARVMIAQNNGGRIINFSSTVGVNGLKGCVDYAAAKGGVIAMTKALAKELAEYGITVNSVAPGIVQRPGEKNEAIQTNFLGQKCTAEDIANMVLFLSSEEAHFITGQTYIVDGGRSLAMKGSD